MVAVAAEPAAADDDWARPGRVHGARPARNHLKAVVIARVLRPGSHVLTKNRVEDLVGEWECVNLGEAAGEAFLQFVRPTGGFMVRGTVFTVAPRASAPLNVTWNLKQRLSNRDIRLEMIRAADGAIMAVHRFSLTVN